MQPLQTTALVGTVSSNLSIFDLFLQSDSVVKIVLLILLLASFWSWAVIFDKTLRLRRLQQAQTGERGADRRTRRKAGTAVTGQARGRWPESLNSRTEAPPSG